MMYRHGLRVSEAIGLRRDELDLDRARLWVRRLKGGLSVEQPIAGDELRAIKRYLATRADALPWLFVSERGQPLTRQAVNYLVAPAGSAPVLPGVHPHTLRHSCGFALADKGHDLRLIQYYLGHRDPRHTVHYTIFPVMAARDFYRDAAAMGGAPHLRTVRAYGGVYNLLNVVNPMLEVINRGKHPRPRAGGIASVRKRGRDQRGYFRPLIADAVAGGETAFDEQFWDALRPATVLPEIVANQVAVFLVGGWHDAFQRGAPLNYAALQNAFAGRPDEQPMQPGQPVSENLRLMMGPWYHVSNYGGLHLQALQLRWFDYWLNDDAGAKISGAPLTFQPIGSPRWFHAREYPLPAATPTRFYLSDAGRLTADCAPETSTATVKYVGRGPVAGRSVEQWTLGMTSFIRTQRGGQTRYDQDNRRLQRGALTYTTEAFATPTLIVGPITLTLHATADTTESLWVAHIDDVAPDGSSRPLTQGALLGSHRALDPARTWYLPDGTVLKPHHISTRAAVKPVVPGELTRYDVEIFPTAALLESGHQLRLTVTTFDFPHLVPTVPARRALAGGTYRLHQGGPTPSHLLIPVAEPGSLD